MKPLEVPSVLLCNPKYPHNVASTIRALSCFGLNTLQWTGDRVNPDEYDRLPREERMKGYAAVQWSRTDRPFDSLPNDVVPVCLELLENSEPLTTFQHPKKAVYIFGPEDGHVPQMIRRFAHRFVHIPSHHCLNLSAAVNVVLYDRRMKAQMAGEEPIGTLQDYLKESRGMIESMTGWDGK